MSQTNAIFNNSILIYKLKQLLMNTGDCILDINHLSNLDITIKSDNSPVTKADIEAHTLLLNGLSCLTPIIPVVSEDQMNSMEYDTFLVTAWNYKTDILSRSGKLFKANTKLIFPLPDFEIL